MIAIFKSRLIGRSKLEQVGTILVAIVVVSLLFLLQVLVLGALLFFAWDATIAAIFDAATIKFSTFCLGVVAFNLFYILYKFRT